MDEEPTFYITDEVGNAMSHSDTPNSKLAPLIYSPNCELEDPKTMTYSVFWVTEEVKKENYLYRDFLNGATEQEWRSSRLQPWFNLYDEYFEGEYKQFQNLKLPFDALELHEKYQTEYPAPSTIDWDVAQQGPIPVYTDYDRVKEYLTDPRFKLVDDYKDAKILWLSWEYEQKKFVEWGLDLSTVYVNWFKNEGALVIKNHIANMINTTLKDRGCIMETYDLQGQLPVFIGAYNDRQKKGLENTWIIKPTNLARSIDTWVTNNLDQIVKLVDTGPKIAQKYIHRPITFKGRKIDLRYVVMMKSLLPLQLYIPDEFYIRFSNNQFTMEETTFQEYETHFTVMNYGNDMTNIRCEEFMKMFDEEYADRGIKFADLNKKVHKAIADCFIAFQARYGKELEAKGNLNNCRALYGVDVMIDQDCNAKLLEVTFAPDMNRFCLFTPYGYNDVFGNLFFNEETRMNKVI